MAMTDDERAALNARLDEIEAALIAAHDELDAIGARTDELGATIARLTQEMEEIKLLLTNGQPPPIDDSWPTPERVVKIDGGGELTEALKSVEPGTHLVLQPGGDFSGTYRVERAGTENNPIFITGTKDAPVNFSGRIVLNAPFTGVGWLKFGGSGNKVLIDAPDCRATRLLFDRVRHDGMIWMGESDTSRMLVDRCEFVDIAGSAIRGHLEDGRKHMNMRVAWCHVNGHRVVGDNESVFTFLTDTFNDSFLTYESNLIEGCLKGATNQKEVISGKTGGLRFIKNTFLNNSNGHVSLRETQHVIAEGNWLEATYFNVYGDGHVFKNNRGLGVLARVKRGDAYLTKDVPARCHSFGKAGQTTIIWKGNRCATAHCASRGLLFDNNVGLIELGENMSSRDRGDFCVRGVVLVNNDRAAKRYEGCVGVVETDVGKGNNTARKLTPADVGRMVA